LAVVLASGRLFPTLTGILRPTVRGSDSGIELLQRIGFEVHTLSETVTRDLENFVVEW
jgi:hypothetical protein